MPWNTILPPFIKITLKSHFSYAKEAKNREKRTFLSAFFATRPQSGPQTHKIHWNCDYFAGFALFSGFAALEKPISPGRIANWGRKLLFFDWWRLNLTNRGQKFTSLPPLKMRLGCHFAEDFIKLLGTWPTLLRGKGHLVTPIKAGFYSVKPERISLRPAFSRGDLGQKRPFFLEMRFMSDPTKAIY